MFWFQNYNASFLKIHFNYTLSVVSFTSQETEDSNWQVFEFPVVHTYVFQRHILTTPCEGFIFKLVH